MSPIAEAAVAAAAAAAPVDRLRARWADDMRAALRGIVPQERDAIAAIVAQPSPGVVYADVTEMLRFAWVRRQAEHFPARPLEFPGTASSAITEPVERSRILRDEFARFWQRPPTPVAALSTQDQEQLRELHLRMVQHSGSAPRDRWYVSEDFTSGSRVQREGLSGLKLHVSTRSVAETVELLARIVPLLPDVYSYKVATDRTLAVAAATVDLSSQRAITNQQRKGITLYLPPNSEQTIAALLHALARPDLTDVIAGDTEIAPGVFLRSDIHVRLPGHGYEDAYDGLYRSARVGPLAADREAHAVLLEEPDLIPAFEAVIEQFGSYDDLVDARAALVIAALGLLDDLDTPEVNESISRFSKNFDVIGREGDAAPRPPADLAAASLRYAAMRVVIDAGQEVSTDTLDDALRDGTARATLQTLIGERPAFSNLGILEPRRAAPTAELPQQPPNPGITNDGQTTIYFKTRSGNIYEARPESDPNYWTVTDLQSGTTSEGVVITTLSPGVGAVIVAPGQLIETSTITEIAIAGGADGHTPASLEREFLSGIGNAQRTRYNIADRPEPGHDATIEIAR